MVQFLSIKFFCWISTIFVEFFKSSRFRVTLYLLNCKRNRLFRVRTEKNTNMRKVQLLSVINGKLIKVLLMLDWAIRREKSMREWRHSSTLSWPQSWMGTSAQHQAKDPSRRCMNTECPMITRPWSPNPFGVLSRTKIHQPLAQTETQSFIT
jgi:hypothetical protein